MLKNPLEILCHANALMVFWAGLYKEMDQEKLIEGANLMLKVAKEVLATQVARHVVSRWILALGVSRILTLIERIAH